MAELIYPFFFLLLPEVSFQQPPQKEHVHEKEGGKSED